MKVSIIGAGHVGLVTAACLAEMGHSIVCVDVDSSKIDMINDGRSPFTERGLEALLRKHIGERLTATNDLRRAVLETDLSFITVGTPFDGQQINLSYVRDASRQIGLALRDKSSYHIVIMKSTVVPGTTDEVVSPLVEQASGKPAEVGFGIGMNPEFLTEGEALQDFMCPDRIVLGSSDPRTLAALDELYACFNGVERLKTSTKCAEMIKYVSNCFLATMISFSNEMARLCEILGNMDVVEVLRGLHTSKYLSTTLAGGERVSPGIVSFLAPGCGFGGSCLPKDTLSLMAHGAQHGLNMRLLKSVIDINREQPGRVVSMVREQFPSLNQLRIAVLGLSFRPETDDVRESPAIPIIRALEQERACVRVYDPAATQKARSLFGEGGSIRVCESLAEALENADAVILVTRWAEFKDVPQLLAGRNPQPLFIDGRRMLKKDSIARYAGIGL